MKRQRIQQTIQRTKEYFALPKFKVECWTRWFNEPTSLSCESLYRFIVVHAVDKEAAVKYIRIRFGDKYKVISVLNIKESI